jgi:hypothetical protein
MTAALLLEILTRNKTGCDPYLWWALLTNFKYVAGLENAEHITGDEPIEILIECTEQFAKQYLASGDPAFPFGELGLTRKPVFISSDQDNVIYSASLPIHIVVGWFVFLGEGVVRMELSSARVAPKVLDHTPMGGTKKCQAIKKPKVCDSKTVAVIIDDGFAFLNNQFKKTNGSTKIAYFWDQNHLRTKVPDFVQVNSSQHPALLSNINRLPIQISGFPNLYQQTSPEWSPVYRFGYGRQLDRATIEGLYQRLTTNKDEVGLYRDLDYKSADPLFTHGTHVADLACKDLDDIDVIMVQLPPTTVQDTSGGGTALHVADAIVYALDRVDVNASVVINLSFGTTAGPHDGSSLIERIMDMISVKQQASRDFVIVLPAGNAFNGKGHAQLSLALNETKTLYWNVKADDPTESFCELWFLKSAWHNLAITMESPSGKSIQVSADNATITTINNVANQITGAIFACEGAVAENQKSQVLIALAPTKGNGGIFAESGVWKIVIENKSSSDTVVVDAWIQRDETPMNTPYFARQSYFLSSRPDLEDDEDDSINDPVKRMGTGNSIAHGKETLVVGGYVVSNGRLSHYSAASISSSSLWPSMLAPADEGPSNPGIEASGTRSGTRYRMNGTSVAVPRVSNYLLSKFLKSKTGTRAYSNKATFLEAVAASSSSAKLSTPPTILTARLGTGLKI